MLEEEQEQEDDDPEIIDEIERRRDEIIQQFMEMSLSRKHDAKERFQ